MKRIIESYKQVRTNSYQLPEEIHLENVCRYYKSKHGHRKERQECIIPLESFLTMHISKRIDMHHETYS